MLTNTFVLNVWEIGSGTTYIGRALRTADGDYALRPRDGLVENSFVTTGMSDVAPVATPAVKGESRKPDEELADEATSRLNFSTSRRSALTCGGGRERQDDGEARCGRSHTLQTRNPVPEGDAGLRIHAGNTT